MGQSYEIPAEMQKDLFSADSEIIAKALNSAASEIPDFSTILSQLQFLESQLYKDYDVSTSPSHLKFMNRLSEWVDLAPDELDQQNLFQLAPRLFFIGKEEFKSLYSTAYDGPVARWLIDQENIDIREIDAQEKLRSALKETWFCPVTDSFVISQFVHINNIPGADYRPDFRVLAEFSNVSKVGKNIRAYKYKRLVLLEDFVGTGKQSMKSLKFALNLPDDIKILFCPMVIAPSGARLIRQMSLENPRFSFASVFELDASAMLTCKKGEYEDALTGKIRETIIRLRPLVTGGKIDELSPFGFSCPIEKGGLLLVMYSNCPANTLPIIHFESADWTPLFPRVSRK